MAIVSASLKIAISYCWTLVVMQPSLTAIQSILVGKQANSGWLITPALTANSSGNTRIINESARFVPLQAMKARLKIYYSYIAK